MVGIEPVSHRVKIWEDGEEMEILRINFKCIIWNYKTLYIYIFKFLKFLLDYSWFIILC